MLVTTFPLQRAKLAGSKVTTWLSTVATLLQLSVTPDHILSKMPTEGHFLLFHANKRIKRLHILASSYLGQGIVVLYTERILQGQTTSMDGSYN